MNYKYLEWDSSFFGYRVAAIEVGCDDIKKYLSALKSEAYKLAYLYVEPSNLKQQQEASRLGLYPIDTRVVLSLDLEQNYEYPEHIEMYLPEEMNPELLKLAYRSGIYSRFAIDPKIGIEKFEQLYALWLKRSLHKEIAHGTFVYHYQNRIAGFITYQLDKPSKKGKIGLIAVAEGMEGVGIGTKLIHAVKYELSQHQCTKLEVVTQKQNIPALKLYAKCGFSIIDELIIYHVWL